MRLNLLTSLFGLIIWSTSICSAQDCKIDLLVAYTQEASDSLLGDSSTVRDIQRALYRMNMCLVYSNVDFEVGLVRTIKLTEYESDCFTHDLDLFHKNSFIESLRNKYHADIAILVLANQEYCGLPLDRYKRAQDSTAFCAVNYYCMQNTFGLSHQVAHLFGCNHYIEMHETANSEQITYGHGYKWRYDEYTGFNTILGIYDDDFCGEEDCNLIPHFSNPEVEYRSVPTGKAGIQNNAKVLDENASEIGAFKTIPQTQTNLTDTLKSFNRAYAVALDTLATGSSYVVQDKARVIFQAGTQVILNPGFRIKEGAQFDVLIKQPDKECN
ncbi:MAG: hypothetical protein JJ975_10780 [Bacteroidia bacterium]|nr:hypothetical protein [Bacteroidia bacterium]